MAASYQKLDDVAMTLDCEGHIAVRLEMLATIVSMLLASIKPLVEEPWLGRNHKRERPQRSERRFWHFVLVPSLVLPSPEEATSLLSPHYPHTKL